MKVYQFVNSSDLLSMFSWKDGEAEKMSEKIKSFVSNPWSKKDREKELPNRKSTG